MLALVLDLFHHPDLQIVKTFADGMLDAFPVVPLVVTSALQ